VLHTLDVSGVMPPEPVLALDELDHSVDPLRVLERLQPSIKGRLYIVESISTLQGIAASANAAWDLDQLGASLARHGRQVVRWSWHLRRLRQAAGYFSCFFF
jgi:hypothetical protein